MWVWRQTIFKGKLCNRFFFLLFIHSYYNVPRPSVNAGMSFVSANQTAVSICFRCHCTTNSITIVIQSSLIHCILLRNRCTEAQTFTFLNLVLTSDSNKRWQKSVGTPMESVSFITCSWLRSCSLRNRTPLTPSQSFFVIFVSAKSLNHMFFLLKCPKLFKTKSGFRYFAAKSVGQLHWWSIRNAWGGRHLWTRDPLVPLTSRS